MRTLLAVLALAVLAIVPLEAQRFSGWALNLGYNYATYPTEEHHYSGVGLGMQVPLGGPIRLNLRAYDQNTSDDWYTDGYAMELGLQAGVGNRVGEISVLAGLSLLGVSDDYVAGGFAPHLGVMARLWIYQSFGVYAEWIRRPEAGDNERQTGLGLGVTIRQWP